MDTCVVSSHQGHQTTFSSEILSGHWSKTIGSLNPLVVVVRTSGDFNSQIMSASWQQNHCTRLISDFEEIYEVADMGGVMVPGQCFKATSPPSRAS
eukprot:5381596-Amphidinium_carterae.1